MVNLFFYTYQFLKKLDFRLRSIKLWMIMAILHLSLITIHGRPFSSLNFSALAQTIRSDGPLRGRGYNLEDLKVLKSEKNHREFLEHATDIFPEGRNELWKSMTTEVAENYLKELLAIAIIKTTDYQLVEKMAQWPVLLENEFIQKDRGLLGLRYLKQCMNKTPDLPACAEQILFFYNQPKVYLPPEEKLGLAQLILDRSIELLALDFFTLRPWSIVQQVLLDPKASFYCQQPLVLKLAKNELLILANKHDSINQLETESLELLGPSCYSQILKSYQNELSLKNIQSTSHEWVHWIKIGLLKDSFFSSGGLHQNTQDLFLTLYLLNSPKKSDLLNLAFNNLKKIHESANRRNFVLKKLAENSLYFGAIFTELKSPSQLLLVGQLSKTFPEYFDLYGKECLNFLHQKFKKLPKINSQECYGFAEFAGKNEWLSKDLQKKYIDHFKNKK
jgi:hypothetical protein